MKRALILLSFLLPVSLLFTSCGGSSTSGGTGSGLKFRAFVSQDVTAGNVGAGLQILDAEKDKRAFVAPITAAATPGMMVVTPNKVQTLVFSPVGNALTLVNNAGESASAQLALPAFTESIVVSPDSRTGYVALPTQRVVDQSPGAIEVVNLGNGGITSEISCPPAGHDPPICLPDGINLPYRHLSISNNGNRLLAFSDNSNMVAVITPSNLGTINPVVQFVDGFDRPVNAFFSGDDNSALVLNCGAECGGVQAGVQTLDLTTNTLGPLVASCNSDIPPNCAGSVALVDGTTMYVAGSYLNPSPMQTLPCPGQTVLTETCGLLTIIDLTNLTVKTSGIVITDGVHNRIALGANGQLFIGARNCSEIVSVSGCLSIYNTQTGVVVVAPANGSVTSIEPIATRSVVYVVQGGELEIYDTTTDKVQETQIQIVGEAVDVKVVDF